MQEYLTEDIVGTSGMRALPVVAGSNESAHYWSKQSACAALVLCIILLSFSLLSEVVAFRPEIRQLGLRNFAWAPK